MSTFEILLAFGVLTLTLTAVISLLYGNQTAMVDTQTSSEALARAEKLLEKSRALAETDFLGATSTTVSEAIGPITYSEATTIADLTPCEKLVTSTASWNTATLRPQKIELTTLLTDVAGALQLGGDCITNPPVSNWAHPTRFASDTFNPGKPLSLDMLDRIAYIGEDKSPFLQIADTHSATLGQTSALFIHYTNGFDAGAPINSLDAINWTNPITGARKVYVFAAMHATSNQLEVIDVTTPTAPILVATVSLPCVDPTGSSPQGWFVYVYGNRLYLVTRFTKGPELHIFDITTPTNPLELQTNGSGLACPSALGYDLGDTTEQLVVRDQRVAGVTKRYAYLATDESDKELRVLDLSNPQSITEATSVNLPGVQDGASVYSIGNKLYFGRMSAMGADLYIYDSTAPESGLPLLGSSDIGTDVLGIRVAGRFAFLATGKTNREFQVWDITNPGNIMLDAIYNFGNIIGQSIDYEPDYIYVTGQSTPNFQILYSP